MQVKKDKEDGNKILLNILLIISTYLGIVGLSIYLLKLMKIEFTPILLITVILFWALFALSCWVLKNRGENIEGRFQKIDENIDNLKDSVANLKDSVANLKNSVASLTGLVNQILDRLGLINKGGMVSANSPITLNEKGKKTASDMEADDIIEAHKDSLIKKLDALNIKNAYDVQVACLNMTNETWAEILAPETLDKIKELAFSKGIELENCYVVLGLKLRDAILSTRNERLGDVEKHSPDDSTD